MTPQPCDDCAASEKKASDSSPSWLGPLGLCALATVLLLGYGSQARHGPALADEHIYLAGARHFARTGTLDARFYDTSAILRQGHPHQDVHAPGYALLLGSLMALLRGTYWTAVGLNVVAYVGGSLLVWVLCRRLGMSLTVAAISGILYLLLPIHLPYVYWVMPEVVLSALFLAALVCALNYGNGTLGAAAAGLLFGLGFLVRESAVFGLPAILAVLFRRRRMWVFLATAAAFGLLVYLPLSMNRAGGGVNFWAADPGRHTGFEAIGAARHGRLWGAVQASVFRALHNLQGVVGPNIVPTEKGILGLFAILPIWALIASKPRAPLEARLRLALVTGSAALIAALLGVSTIAGLSGLRYLMFLMPPFLPWVAASISASGSLAGRGGPSLVVGVLCIALNVSTYGILNRFKISRQGRQERLTAYVERYVNPRQATRIVLFSGWLFGLRHYPVEVISSLPRSGGELRALEQAVWFDYLVLPVDSPFADEVEGRARYRRVNGQESDPPLRIYRRLK